MVIHQVFTSYTSVTGYSPLQLHPQEPLQPKALFRRGKALMALKEHQAASNTNGLRSLEMAS